MEVERRTDVGTVGQEVALLSNHWAWEGEGSQPGLPKAKVYRYSVLAKEVFDKDETSGLFIHTGKPTSTQKRHIYHRAFRQIRRDNTAMFCGNPHGYAYDGAGNMFALTRLAKANVNNKSKFATIVKMEKRNQEEDYDRKISMEFSFIDEMDLSVIDLLHYMDKETIKNDGAMKQTALQVIETFCNQIFYENVEAFSFAQFGQSNYAMLHDADIARGQVRIGNGLYVVQGVNCSVTPIMGTRIWDNIRGITGAELLQKVRENNENNNFSLGMNIDLCTTAMYVPQNCTWLVLEILNKQKKGDSTGQTNVHDPAPKDFLQRSGISDRLKPWQLDELRKHMRDLQVVPLHGRVRNTFKVSTMGAKTAHYVCRRRTEGPKTQTSEFALFHVSNITNCNDTAHTKRFRTDDGYEYSVFEFYRQIHRYTLQYPNWPLLVHEALMRDGGKRESHYPIEVCEPVDMQPVVKRMSKDVAKEVIRHAALHPDARMKRLNELIKLSNLLNNPAMQALGIAPGSLKQLEVTGRLLNPPKMSVARQQEVQLNRECAKRNFTKKVNSGPFDIQRNTPFYVPASADRWFGMMILPEQGDEMKELCNQRDYLKMFYAFGRNLSHRAAGHGMRLPVEPEYMTRDGKSQNERYPDMKWVHLRTLQEEVQAFFEGKAPCGLPAFKPGDLIICIVPDAGKSEYSWAKLLTHDLFVVKIQVVKYSTFRRAAGWNWNFGRRPAKIEESLLFNLCLQLNEKLGGTAWNIRDADGQGPKIMTKLRGQGSTSKGGQYFESETMFLGMDVAHPKVDDRNKKARKDRSLYFVPSFVAMTGSIDHVPFRYHKASRAQPEHLAEIVDRSVMKDLVTEMINAWTQEGNRAFPKNIILYRDGISIEQSKMARDVEVDAIRDACIDLGFSPKIAVFLVVKRHRVRPVLKDIPKGDPNNPKDPNHKASAKNVKPGTVVDTVIVIATERPKQHTHTPEFFMVGHEGIMGTSCWVRVRVLLNELNLTADEYQALSYYMCYGYFGCAKPVSLPAPVMLAHKYADYTINTLFKTWEVMTGQTDRSQPTDVDAINEMLRTRSGDVLNFSKKM